MSKFNKNGCSFYKNWCSFEHLSTVTSNPAHNRESCCTGEWGWGFVYTIAKVVAAMSFIPRPYIAFWLAQSGSDLFDIMFTGLWGSPPIGFMGNAENFRLTCHKIDAKMIH